MKGRSVFARVLAHACLSIMFAAAGTARAEQPSLHDRIDVLVESAQIGTPTRVTTDGEFLRRISLDLLGRIPTSAEARAFLADPSLAKRAEIIDQMLASPEHVRHMTHVFDVMWMERRADKHVPTGEWRQYLYDSIAANKPYHQLVKEILAADGTVDKNRHAARFFLEREGEPNLLTRDVGRMFFGKDLQCAQCHDHPLISDYFQSDYYGLYAFFSRASLFTDPADKKVYLQEKGEGADVTFKSVFTQEEGATGPRLLGESALEEPVFAKGDEYVVKPDANVRSVPRYSRLARLAEEVGHGENMAFRRNAANRLWAMMTGRGLVDPVDLHHSDNPAIHAQLLDLLATEFAGMNFDIRALLREIALTRTYQRAFVPPDDWNTTIELATAAAPQLDQQLAAAAAQVETAVTVERAAHAALTARREEIAPQRTAYEQARLAAAEAEAAERVAVATLAATQQQLDAKRPTFEAVAAAASAAKVAAEKLVDAPEAADAAAKFQAHAEKLRSELAALEIALPEQQKALVEKQHGHAQAQQALALATQQWEPIAASLRSFEHQAAVAANQLRSAQAVHAVAERQLETAKVAAAAKPVLDSVLAAEQAVQQAEQQLAAARTRESALAAQGAALAKALAEAQQPYESQLTKIAALTNLLATRREATDLVVLASAQLRDASGTLPNDSDLAGALATLAAQEQRLSTTTETLAEQLATEQSQLGQFESSRSQAAQAVRDHESALAAVREQLAAADAQLAAARSAAELQQATLPATLTQLEDAWTRQLALAPLKALSPEQLGWSILEATGVTANYRAAVEAELKAKPEIANLSPEAFRAELEKGVYGKLEPAVGEFVRLFGAGPGQPQTGFFATVDQALFLANGGSLRPWLVPSGSNLTARLAQLQEPAQVAEELYLAVFTRQPTPEETEFVTTSLAGLVDQQRTEALQELAWGLITSAEFRFCP